jgi:uncharacterized integral membrane protein
MGRIIFSILSLIALAVIIVMNAGLQTDFNLLGWQLESLPVTAIAIACFVLGVLYSFIFYFASYLAKGRRERLAAKRQRLKTQEQQIKSRDADLKQREKQVTALVDQDSSASGEKTPKRGLAGLFGQWRSRGADSGSETSSGTS